MEISLFNVVKIASAIYILCKVWIWLFGGSAEKYFWGRILTPISKAIPEPKPRPASSSVIGATKKVVYEDPRRGLRSGVISTDLEPTGYIGEEEDISAQDVESDYRPSDAAIPSNDDLYDDPDANGYDPELSGGGVTFEQIGEAINALTGVGAIDDAVKSRARETLIELRNTDILDMITREVCDEQTLEQFLNDSDTTGKAAKPEDIRIKDFDMTIYV